MTPAVKHTPVDVLREARRRDSDRKRDQVFRTVDAMKRGRHADHLRRRRPQRQGLHSGWSMRAVCREYIENARIKLKQQVPLKFNRVGGSASEASLRTDLELAKQDNRQTSGSRLDRLMKALRERLGSQSKLYPLNRCGDVPTSSLRQTSDTAAITRGL